MRSRQKGGSRNIIVAGGGVKFDTSPIGDIEADPAPRRILNSLWSQEEMMSVTHKSATFPLLLAFGTLFLAMNLSQAYGDPNPPSTKLSLATATQVPGLTLGAGAYTIRVVDHLSDRMIIQVERGGKTQATFLALPSSQLARTNKGPITLGAGAEGKSALRGFAFADGTVAEFVYPKAEAVALAKANGTTIPAIDPASEGRVDTPSLSKTDMQMVTLWMLTPTTVGPNDSGPGIQAARYQPASAGVPAAAHKSRPLMAALPHTAGFMPLIELAGLLSLVGALWMRGRALTASR